MKHKTTEQRLDAIEHMIREIYVALTPVRRIDGVDEREYRRAIEALMKGDTRPLADYKARGGVVPMAAGNNGR